MKFGKQHIHDLAGNDVTDLGAYAQQLQFEAEARGEVLPPAIRLHIGEPSFVTPEHIRRAAIQAIETEQMTYGPATGWLWLRELLAEKIKRVDGYSVGPEHIAVAVGGTGAILASLTATVGVGEEFESGRCICIYSFSKTYAMTGWRLGYIVAGTELIKTITNVLNSSYTNVSTIQQRAGAAALTGSQECVTEMREAYRLRRNLAINLLKDFGRYTCTPHGTFFLLINVSNKMGQSRSGRKFALDLLRERNVAVASGNNFGSVAESYVRISLAASEEEIERGVREICAFADR